MKNFGTKIADVDTKPLPSGTKPPRTGSILQLSDNRKLLSVPHLPKEGFSAIFGILGQKVTQKQR